jgi:hypothetical protein
MSRADELASFSPGTGDDAAKEHTFIDYLSAAENPMNATGL